MNGDERRSGGYYRVSEEEVARFRRDGYVHLEGVLSQPELAEIDEVYTRFLDRQIEVPGKDYCDMSGRYDLEPDEFAVINVMLPTRYLPEWRGNLYEVRAASIAAQLHGDDLVVDYDQLLAKAPGRDDAVFAWHQDQAYWPVTPDTRTATLWLALDDSTVENGCMRFVPGSHTEPRLREHRPLHDDREHSHTLCTTVDEEAEDVRYATLRRGDVTVHGERVLHGSGGNWSDGWRRAYIIAFRSRATVAEERRLGFTHSHNDDQSVLREVGIEGESQ